MNALKRKTTETPESTEFGNETALSSLCLGGSKEKTTEIPESTESGNEIALCPLCLCGSKEKTTEIPESTESGNETVLSSLCLGGSKKEMAELNLLSQKTIGAAIEVHRHLGPGFLESVYEDALCIELNLQGIRFERQKSISVVYKGFPVGEGRLDLLVENRLIVELKAVEEFHPVHKAQVISYLKSTNLKLGLLINFKVKELRHGIKRIIL
ncbi:MAG TPA: GxxExxY protein [Fibrobacteraceae bacterium]|nr:GxxExxY protein [Fibrobacteraceae bacterium]